MMIATQQETSSEKRLERRGEMRNEYKLLPGKPE
jgi:hypothetical protein